MKMGQDSGANGRLEQNVNNSEDGRRKMDLMIVTRPTECLDSVMISERGLFMTDDNGTGSGWRDTTTPKCALIVLHILCVY
jgi:hypothetical protein